MIWNKIKKRNNDNELTRSHWCILVQRLQSTKVASSLYRESQLKNKHFIEYWSSPSYRRFKIPNVNWNAQAFDSFHRINRTHIKTIKLTTINRLPTFSSKPNVSYRRNGWDGRIAGIRPAKWYCVHAVECEHETKAIRHGQAAGIGRWRCGKLNRLHPIP